MANMVRAISGNGGIVICALDSTEMVREMERIHKTSAVASAALGRLLTGASLMGSWLKDEGDSITLRVNGGGVLGTLVAVTDGEGNVRGYAQHPYAEVPLSPKGKLDVGAAVGTDGTLSVVKDMGLKEPYVGQVPLVSGEIAIDITSYYATSEQTPTVCALGVLVNKDLTIQKAGGYLLQLLPGALDEEIDQIEKNVGKIPAITQLLQDGGTIYDMVELGLEGFAPEILEEKDVAYKCHCSEEKSEEILASLGREELEALKKEQDTAQVECHFCDKKYVFKLEEMLEKLNGN